MFDKVLNTSPLLTGTVNQGLNIVTKYWQCKRIDSEIVTAFYNITYNFSSFTIIKHNVSNNLHAFFMSSPFFHLILHSITSPLSQYHLTFTCGAYYVSCQRKSSKNKIWLWGLNFKCWSWPTLAKQPINVQFCAILVLLNHLINVTRK